MKLSRGKLSIILFLVGFLFIVLDVNIDTGMSYPNNYNNSDNVIGEFQYYNIKSTYGASCTYKMIEDKHDSSLSDDNSDAVSTNEAKVIDKVFFDNIHIDIFNDIVGFILIAIAAFLLKNKGNRQFNYAILLSIISLILSIIIYILPFFVNGILLCNLVFAIGFAYLFAGVITTFFYTNGFLKLAPGIACRDERGWIKATWYVIVVGFVLATFVYWLGSDYHALIVTGNVFTFVIICLIVVYYLLAKRVLDYINENYNSQK